MDGDAIAMDGDAIAMNGDGIAMDGDAIAMDGDAIAMDGDAIAGLGSRDRDGWGGAIPSHRRVIFGDRRAIPMMVVVTPPDRRAIFGNHRGAFRGSRCDRG